MTATSTILKNLNMPKEKKHQFIKECVMFLSHIRNKASGKQPIKVAIGQMFIEYFSEKYVTCSGSIIT